MKETATIVVPCYNEEMRLMPEEFEVFCKRNRHVRFLFVNDASTDRTSNILTSLCEQTPEQMHCINLAVNSGKAGAVQAGFQLALKGPAEFIGYWDADLSTPLTDVNNLIGLFDDPSINIVMASRVQLLGRNIERKKTRHYFGRMFATLASIILELKVYDTQCGAKLFRANEALKAVFALPFRVRWTFDVEILARYIALNKGDANSARPAQAIIEYPLMSWKDAPGSKVKLKDAFVAIPELYRIYSFLHRSNSKRLRRALLENSEEICH